MKRLQGKVAIVTGAGGAIGRSISLTLAKHGAKVACVDLAAENCAGTVSLIEQVGGVAKAYCVDLSIREGTHELLRDVEATFGRVDTLVNNAMWIKYEPIEELREDTVEKMFDIGLKAMFWTIQASLPALSRNGGSIINMASMNAIRGTANRIVYCTVKGGVVAMTLECAVELGPRKIRVNAIAPGAVPNPGMLARLSPELIKLRMDTTPLGRLGEPQDVADIVLFLASDESTFVTGALIPVDGGRMIAA